MYLFALALLLFFSGPFIHGRTTPVIVSEEGVVTPSMDAVGLFSPHKRDIPADVWKGILYTDYSYMMKGTSSVFRSSVLADMAVFFLSLTALPPGFLAKNKHQNLSIRMAKLLNLGHLDLVEGLWLGANSFGDPPLDVCKVYVSYLVCMDRVREARKLVEKTLQDAEKPLPDQEKMSKAKLTTWKRTYRILQMLDASCEDACNIAEMQNILSEHVAEDDFSDIRKIVLNKSFKHVTHWNALLVKLVCRFVPITSNFIEELPKEFYSVVYHDQVWIKITDDLRLKIVEHLVRVGALDGQTLLRFYTQADTTVLPVPVHTRKIPAHIADAAKKDCDPLMRACAYQMLQSAYTEDRLYQERGLLLDAFVRMLSKAGFLFVAAKELSSFVVKIEPNEQYKNFAPSVFLISLLCRDMLSKESYEKWRDLALSVNHPLPVVPIYIILNQDFEERNDLMKVFADWYKKQKEHNESIDKSLWVLAMAAPWLPAKVSLPQIAITTTSHMTVDGFLYWAHQSGKKGQVLGALVGRASSQELLPAIGPALFVNKDWGRKLAVESLLMQ